MGERAVSKRPFSADPVLLKKKQFGTTIPIIIRHHDYLSNINVSLPNENVNLQKFFNIQERPRTAVSHSNAATNLNKSGRSLMRPSTGKSVRPNSSQKIFQLDLSKFADQWGTSSKPIIRPKKQLKTNLLHSVLYKMKMEKDILEEKINNLEQWQYDYREQEINLISNTGAVDYLLSLNARSNPSGLSGEYLANQKEQNLNKKNQRSLLRNTFSGSARKINLRTQGIADLMPSSASERNEDDVQEEIQRYLSKDQKISLQSVADRQAIRSNSLIASSSIKYVLNKDKINSYIERYDNLRNLLHENEIPEDLANADEESIEQAFHRMTKASTATNIRKFEIGLPIKKGEGGPKIDRIHKRPQTANTGGSRFFSDVKKTAIQARGSNNQNVNAFPTASEDTDPSIQLQGSKMRLEAKVDHFDELQEQYIVEKPQLMSVQTHYLPNPHFTQNVFSPHAGSPREDLASKTFSHSVKVRSVPHFVKMSKKHAANHRMTSGTQTNVGDNNAPKVVVMDGNYFNSLNYAVSKADQAQNYLLVGQSYKDSSKLPLASQNTAGTRGISNQNSASKSVVNSWISKDNNPYFQRRNHGSIGGRLENAQGASSHRYYSEQQ